MTFLRRDQLEVEALLTDRYLESLLLAHDRRAQDTPTDPSLDSAVRSASRRLSTDLVRIHPSFRFEERLAARLAEVAARMRLAQAAGGENQGTPLAHLPELPEDELRALGLADLPRTAEPAATSATSASAAPAATTAPGAVSRPILIGGAITSAAISLAGAAYVAWRLTHQPAHPMARAARQARRRAARSSRAMAGLD